MIRTVKTLFYKANHEEALLSYRATPLGPNQPSPAQLMFNRKIQTNLPAYIRGHEYQTREQPRLETNKNQTVGKQLQELHVNQPIFYQDVAKKIWTHGVVIGIGPEPKSYTIRCSETGRALKRNRILLRPRTVSFEVTTHQTTAYAQSLHEHSPAENLEPPSPDSVEDRELPSPDQAPNSHNATVPPPKETPVEPPPSKPTPDKPQVQATPVRGYITRSGRQVNKPKRLIESQ